MTLGRLEISGGALLAVALLLYLDRSGVWSWALLACALHELGHWWAIHALGGRVVCLRVTCAGAELRMSVVRPLPPVRMVLAALAGPGMNLLVALAGITLARRGVGERLYLFAGLNLGLAVFNLLPAGWLDGGRALESLLTWRGREELGQRVTDLCAFLVAALLLAGGMLLFWQSGGRNFTILVAGLWMTGAVWRESGRGKGWEVKKR